MSRRKLNEKSTLLASCHTKVSKLVLHKEPTLCNSIRVDCTFPSSSSSSPLSAAAASVCLSSYVFDIDIASPLVVYGAVRRRRRRRRRRGNEIEEEWLHWRY
jgi:hypothetical protein